MYVVEWSKWFKFFQKIKKNIKPNIDDFWKPNTKSSTKRGKRQRQWVMWLLYNQET